MCTETDAGRETNHGYRSGISRNIGLGRAPKERDDDAIALEHGYRMEGESRPMTWELLNAADLIIVMTSQHREEVIKLTDSIRQDRIHLFMDYCWGESVPLQDPILGSESFFRNTFEKIERGCRVILGKCLEDTTFQV